LPTSRGRAGADEPSSLVWFRRDLRLHDHAALRAAAAAGRPLVACYVLDERGQAAPGAASRWWLHGSLAALIDALRQQGGELLLRRGDSAEEVAALATACGAVDVHCSKSYEPDGRRAEAQLRGLLEARGARLVVHAGDLLFDPEQLRTQVGEPFRVFTPFWNACRRAEPPGAPLPVPSGLRFARQTVASESLDSWRLRPVAPDWAGGLRAGWSPGEFGARARLAVFLDRSLRDYGRDRDRPDRAGSSRLSPHLHFGELSPRTVWHGALRQGGAEGTEAFVRELGWREFARHLLWHWPAFAKESFRAEFRRFPWRDDPDALARWQRGLTGYPFVDAGMRELWHTGWMHNRVRMVASSFLVKHLLIPWQRGAEWFSDTLVDADLANNSVGWQWVAGSGADAAPYFRIFNPLLQARKFDPDGTYVRRWLPALAGLPTQFVHEPPAAPVATLRAARVELGVSYPWPLVAHGAARARALAAYAAASGARGGDGHLSAADV
jgi:deoxyribodipyrimidine photo-lyase